jgi:protein-S-isoprenylcysteine O-methyltransferase Ste14
MKSPFQSTILSGESTVYRLLAFLYGSFAYVTFLGVFLYAVGFLGGFAVPKSIDSSPEAPFKESMVINGLLLGLFALQHSVMARPWFKKWWTRFVPQSIERSTYVLFTNIALALLFWQWQPLGGVIWNVENQAGRAAIYSLFALGWMTVLLTTFLINHFDLFGLRQVWFFLRGKPYTPLGFVTPGPYRIVRHPLYIGWLLVFWSTPSMTASHLLFTALTTLYILVAIRFEERDLVEHHGKKYAEYRERVGMLLPRLPPPRKETEALFPPPLQRV